MNARECVSLRENAHRRSFESCRCARRRAARLRTGAGGTARAVSAARNRLSRGWLSDASKVARQVVRGQPGSLLCGARAYAKRALQNGLFREPEFGHLPGNLWASGPGAVRTRDHVDVRDGGRGLARSTGGRVVVPGIANATTTTPTSRTSPDRASRGPPLRHRIRRAIRKAGDHVAPEATPRRARRSRPRARIGQLPGRRAHARASFASGSRVGAVQQVVRAAVPRARIGQLAATQFARRIQFRDLVQLTGPGNRRSSGRAVRRRPRARIGQPAVRRAGPERHMMSEVSDVATQLCALPTFDDSVCGHSKRRTAMSSKLWVMEDSTGRIC